MLSVFSNGFLDGHGFLLVACVRPDAGHKGRDGVGDLVFVAAVAFVVADVDEVHAVADSLEAERFDGWLTASGSHGGGEG